jgi:hypothetical protein
LFLWRPSLFAIGKIIVGPRKRLSDGSDRSIGPFDIHTSHNELALPPETLSNLAAIGKILSDGKQDCPVDPSVPYIRLLCRSDTDRQYWTFMLKFMDTRLLNRI